MTTPVRVPYARRSVPSVADALPNWLTTEFGSIQRAIRGVPDLFLSVKADFGAVGNGQADDTVAFLKAARAGVNVFIPAGTYLLTSQVTIPTGVEWFGAGTKTVLLFRPTAAATCIAISAGTNQAVNNIFRDIAFYSDDTTYTKVALDLVDVSSCAVENIYVYGTGTGYVAGPFWSGNGSIGIRTKGREISTVRNVRIVADYPVYIAANPNTSATDGEDMDHWVWDTCYLVANGHYAITVANGLGLMETRFDNQAWVGGTGGFSMNDTRVAPTITSRGISFSQVRGEQCSDANGYWFNITCTQPALTIGITKALGAATAQGISVNGCLQLVMDRCVMATANGKQSLLMAGAASGATITILGCYWQPSSVFTTTGYNLMFTAAWATAVSQGPSTAVYSNSVAGSLAFLERLTAFCAAGTRGVVAQGTANDDAIELLPFAAGSGGALRSVNGANSDFEPMAQYFETLTLRYRTGVATTAIAAQIDTAGQMSLLTRLFLGTDAGAIQSACGLYAGTGAPNNANGSNGDYYFRSDGGVATHIYFKAAGAWAGII